MFFRNSPLVKAKPKASILKSNSGSFKSKKQLKQARKAAKRAAKAARKAEKKRQRMLRLKKRAQLG